MEPTEGDFSGPCGGSSVEPESWVYRCLWLCYFCPYFVHLSVSYPQTLLDSCCYASPLVKGAGEFWCKRSCAGKGCTTDGIRTSMHLQPRGLTPPNACLPEVACSAHDKDMLNLEGHLSLQAQGSGVFLLQNLLRSFCFASPTHLEPNPVGNLTPSSCFSWRYKEIRAIS